MRTCLSRMALAVQVPPIVGIDSMHGANYVQGATLYPHALHVAASFEPAHAYASARSAARHTRGVGISWVFAPVVDVAVATRFPRVYESAGEDPRMAEVFGVAIVEGLQGMPLATEHLQRVLQGGGAVRGDAPAPQAIPDDLSAPDVVAACMKHFVGYVLQTQCRIRRCTHRLFVAFCGRCGAIDLNDEWWWETASRVRPFTVKGHLGCAKDVLARLLAAFMLQHWQK
jgi:beta-glucosidase-like glycosyl hydrolase